MRMEVTSACAYACAFAALERAFLAVPVVDASDLRFFVTVGAAGSDMAAMIKRDEVRLG